MSDPYYIFYQSAMIISLLASAFVIMLTWQHHKANGAKAMISLAAATFLWTLGFFLETNSTTLERQLIFDSVGYIGSMTVPVAWFVFAVNYTRDNRPISEWKFLPFGIFPLITVILVWTNNWHHLMWYDEHLIATGPFISTAKSYGVFFWIALAHNYILIIIGSIVLLRQLFVGTPLYTRQAISLVAAVALPWIWNIIYVFNLVPLPRKDLTPVMFAVSGIAIALGLLRYQLFMVIPFARKFIIQHLNDGIMVFDTDNLLLEANPAALRIFGADNNIIGKKIHRLPQLAPLQERFAYKGSGSIELALTVSEEECVYELETVSLLDKTNRQTGWLAILHDITKRRLQELEYRTIIQTTMDGFWLADLEGRFLDVNEAYCELTGYRRDELLKMRISDIEAIEAPQETASRITGIKLAGKDRFETRHRHKDGRIIDVEISVNYVEVAGGRLFVFIRDISDRKKIQEQLIAQDRLASIGELTSGVAHELNNPLASVIGFSELLLRKELPEEVRHDLYIITGEADRAARIVDNLLAFARKQPEEKSPINLNDTIARTLELRAHEQEINNIRTVTRLDPDMPEIMGNDFQFRQVFLNIIINAEYFMTKEHSGGTITITTGKTGDFVRVSFTDDGPGIPRDNIAHLFDPFFTTKEVGKGTGLGLSICHGIVTGHGGRIWAESQPGKGATFNIELPVYHEQAAAAKQPEIEYSDQG